jgi:hypothetical protein
MLGPKRLLTNKGKRCQTEMAHLNFALEGLKSGSGPLLDNQ